MGGLYKDTGLNKNSRLIYNMFFFKQQQVVKFQTQFRFPLNACSISTASNSALKLPGFIRKKRGSSLTTQKERLKLKIVFKKLSSPAPNPK